MLRKLIFKNGSTLVFQQTMDKNLLRDILIFEIFLLMAAKKSFDCVLNQDNDAKHLSGLLNKI